MNVLPRKPAGGEPKRRWFRFTLRTFLLAVLGLGVACSWLGSHLNRQHQQLRIVRQLQAHGHSVRYDYEMNGGSPAAWKPPGPWILRRCFGDDLFAHVTYVCLDGKQERDDFRALLKLPMLSDVESYRPITDAESLADLARVPQLRSLGLEAPAEILERLSAAQELETLILNGSQMQDDDLQVLPSLRKLQHLSLWRTQITAAGMEHVSRIPRLRSLRIYIGLSIDDAALVPIGKLTNLEVLALGQTSITDDGLGHLQALKQLQSLDLRATNVTDEGMVHLSGFQKLHELTLSMKIGDAGLQRLMALQSLQSVNLNSSSVTDEGMKSLAQLRVLKTIYMPYTKVTDAGIWELRTLPDLEGLTTGGNVTMGGAARLREHLPNCAICGVNNSGGDNFVLR